MKTRSPLAGLTALLLAAGLSHGSDWPRWRGPEGNGISKETKWRPQALAPQAKVLWKFDLGQGHASVSIAARRLYTMGNSGDKDTVYCLEAETGKPLWRHSYPCEAGEYPGPRATPVVDGELVYTLSRDGHAFCLDAATGRVKWQKDLVRDFGATMISWGMAGSPLVTGDLVVYNARASGIALNRMTGEKVWMGEAGECGYASPVLFKHAGKDLLAIFSATDVHIVELATGRPLQAFGWQTEYNVNAADPVYFDGKLFISSGYDRGCALLDLAGAAPKAIWENTSLRSHFASPVYLDGHIYGVDGNTGGGQLRCIDARTGNVKWTQGGRFENFVIAGDKIIAIDARGTLTVAQADPSAFKEVARATVLSGTARNWTAPVLANGLLYCRNSAGEILCIDVR